MPIDDENLFIVSSCEKKGVEFLLGNGKTSIRKKSDPDSHNSAETIKSNSQSESRDYTISVNGDTYNVRVIEGE